MKKLKAWLRYYRYPQKEWAAAIAHEISRLDLKNEQLLIDAPCGDGIISYWLQYELPDKKMVMCDIDKHLTSIARENVTHCTAYTQDLLNIKLDGTAMNT